MFANRSVVEIMVLVFTLIIGVTVIGTGLAVAVVEIMDPTVDTSRIVDSLTSIITGILGALLGLLAGKSESMQALGTRPNGKPDSVPDP